MTDKEKRLIRLAKEETMAYKEDVESDPYRLSYHLMPPVGLLNDPNGLIEFNGTYHVFYQWNPFELSHGPKFWGHYTSTDLVHWEEEPVALVPSEWYEKNGCYSGSAVEHDGKLHLFYTGNVKDEHNRRETYQCLAVSSDGVHFDKKGPVLRLPEGYTAHFRDPKVWSKEGIWYMVVGAQTVDEKGAAALFSSEDLYEWKHLGSVAGAGLNGLGDFGYMWECPDLFRLGGKDILLVSPQGLEPQGFLYQNLFQSGYFAGELNEAAPTFAHGAFTELDRGFDFYAPQTMEDSKGRRLMWAWMGITDENEQHQPTISNRWVHALTMPRELKWQDGKLHQVPVDEMKALRRNHVAVANAEIREETWFEGISGVAVELLIDVAGIEAGEFRVELRNGASLIYDGGGNVLTLARNSLRGDGRETRSCYVGRLERLHVFLDSSSIEIFVNGGAETFTARYFPEPEDESITFSSTDGTTCTIRKWELG